MAFSFAGIRDEIADQKDRLFVWIPVAFGVGIGGYFGLPSESGVYAALIPVVLSAPVLFWLHRRQFLSLSWFLAFLAGAFLFTASCGFFAAKAGTILRGTPILQKSIGPVSVEGDVESVEALGGKDGSRVVLSRLSIENLSHDATPRKIRLRFKKDQGLKAGERVSTLAKIEAPSQAVLPGAYDFRRHLFFEGIGGVGFSYTSAQVIRESVPGGAGLFFEKARHVIDEKIAGRAGEVSAGIMSALVTGTRGAIADEDNDAMRDSGLYHLLSISGSHVSMVAGILFFFSRFLMACFPWVALHWPIKKIAAIMALSGSAFYVFLAGADVPALRALMVTGLVMLAIILDRSPFSLRLVAFSALVVLLNAPHSLVGVSFQMSFAAVAAIICFFDYIRPWWMAWYARVGFVRKSMMYLLGVITTSIIAGTVTGLFSLYHFQTFSVYGVLSNMIAVPLMGGVIMPAAIVALMLMPFGLQGWALEIMEWGVVWMLAVAHWTAGLEGAVFHVAQWPPATFFLMVCGIVLFLLWTGWRGKGLALALICAGLITAGFARQPDVMVSGSGKLVAVRDEGGELFFSSGRKERFVAENWLRLAGREGEKPRTFKAQASPVLCDDDGCRVEIKGKKVAFVHTPRAFYEDCGWADLVVADIPLSGRKCAATPVVIDLYDALDNGAHAVYLGEDGVEVRSVGEEIGERAWTGDVKHPIVVGRYMKSKS